MIGMREKFNSILWNATPEIDMSWLLALSGNQAS